LNSVLCPELRVGDTQKAGKFEEAPSLRINFKSRRESHALTEDVRYYNDLKTALADDANNTDAIRDVRREMPAN